MKVKFASVVFITILLWGVGLNNCLAGEAGREVTVGEKMKQEATKLINTSERLSVKTGSLLPPRGGFRGEWIGVYPEYAVLDDGLTARYNYIAGTRRDIKAQLGYEFNKALDNMSDSVIIDLLAGIGTTIDDVKGIAGGRGILTPAEVETMKNTLRGKVTNSFEEAYADTHRYFSEGVSDLDRVRYDANKAFSNAKNLGWEARNLLNRNDVSGAKEKLDKAKLEITKGIQQMQWLDKEYARMSMELDLMESHVKGYHKAGLIVGEAIADAGAFLIGGVGTTAGVKAAVWLTKTPGVWPLLTLAVESEFHGVDQGTRMAIRSVLMAAFFKHLYPLMGGREAIQADKMANAIVDDALRFLAKFGIKQLERTFVGPWVKKIVDDFLGIRDELGQEAELGGAIASSESPPGQGVADAKSSGEFTPGRVAPDATGAVGSTSGQFTGGVAPDAAGAVGSISGQFGPGRVAPDVAGAFRGIVGPTIYGGGPGGRPTPPPGTGWTRIGPTRPGQNIGGQWWFDFGTTTWYHRPGMPWDYPDSGTRPLGGAWFGDSIPRPMNDLLHEIGEADRRRMAEEQD